MHLLHPQIMAYERYLDNSDEKLLVFANLSLLMYWRGHQMAKKLSKDDSNLAVWQIYLISTVIL